MRSFGVDGGFAAFSIFLTMVFFIEFWCETTSGRFVAEFLEKERKNVDVA